MGNIEKRKSCGNALETVIFCYLRQDIEVKLMNVAYCVDESRARSNSYSLSWRLCCCFSCLAVAFRVITCRSSSLCLAFPCIFSLILLILGTLICCRTFFLIDFFQLLLCNFLELFRSTVDLLEKLRDSLVG